MLPDIQSTGEIFEHENESESFLTDGEFVDWLSASRERLLHVVTF
jgi:hypothetical protein